MLAECGSDIIIGYWDATITAQIKANKDTLLIEQIWNLPTGENFEYQPTVYLIDHIYKIGNKTVVGSTQNNNLQKYTPAEIQQVLEEYKELSDELQDDTMEMANKLFIAAISGSKKAHDYFIDFDKKFMLDGAFAEEYKDLAAVLRFYVD